jgi:hypothetical protein
MYWGYAAIVPNDEHRRRLLNRIASCIGRCTLPSNKQWHHYGGRGITVHPAWAWDRGEFLRYIITLPGWDDPGLELDRVENNKGYEPGNLRFISRRDNMLNRRKISHLQQRVQDLEAEVARLRSGELRAA